MGKRSDFKRRANDAYFTPMKAVLPLLPHLPSGPFEFIEPCAGDGRLVRHLEANSPGRCVGAYDINPLANGIVQRNAMTLSSGPMFITNPPWTRQLLHPLIEHLSAIAPTWFLFDADWAQTKQAAPYLRLCRKIVAVGRVSWMENGTSGKDNSSWYLFDRKANAQAEFYGAAA